MERIAGRIPVIECLRAGKRPARRLYLLRGGKDLDEVRAAARGLAIEEVDRRRLDQLVEGAQHQGVVLEAMPLPILLADDWVHQPFSESAVAVVLDGVEDPHNFGAIVRSAAAFGACAVVFGKDRAAPISTASVKSAAGAMERIDLVRATNVVRALDALKERGFWVAGLDAGDAQSIWDANLTGRIALVIGGEGKGMRRLVREHCDLRLHIPMPGPMAALNASVSAAIALAECARQRVRA